MNRLLITACLLLPAFFIANAQSAKLDYRIAAWQNDKKAAVSLTFDDGISGQFNIAVPILNRHNFKATFFVTTNTVLKQMGDWLLVKSASQAGHEIANHALSHPHFDSTATAVIESELVQSNKIIETQLPIKSITHAYPFGEGGKATAKDLAVRSIVKKYFIGARATQNKSITYNTYDFAKTTDDYFTINSVMIADTASMAAFNSNVDETITAGGWYVPTYHGIQNGWLIVPATAFEQHLNYLDKQQQHLWIAPFVNVLKYHKERNCATLNLLAEDKQRILLQLTDTLQNDKLYNEPLTIILKINNYKIKTIQQGDDPIIFNVKAGNVMFNAVPGKGNIIITKK